MNRTAFFAAVKAKPFGKGLTQSQVDGLNAILDVCHVVGDKRFVAYMLATAYHETAHTMQPIREYGRGRGRKYGTKGKHGQVAYGRGYVQLTWDYNYEKADRELGLSGRLTRDYDLALDLKIASAIMLEGMCEGWFTGKKLADYFNGEKTDWRNARRIINGTDKAALIAGYAQAFYAALLKVDDKPAVIIPPPPDAMVPDLTDVAGPSSRDVGPQPQRNNTAALVGIVAALSGLAYLYTKASPKQRIWILAAGAAVLIGVGWWFLT